MNISQKCQYAVRATLELAKRFGNGPTPIGEVAARQAIPPRFLEIILNEMKQGGFVESRRGVQGGYMLIPKPADLTVGQIIRFVDGSFDPVKCLGETAASCEIRSRCALMELWTQAKTAVESVYDGTNFQQLAEREFALERAGSGEYHI